MTGHGTECLKFYQSPLVSPLMGPLGQGFQAHVERGTKHASLRGQARESVKRRRNRREERHVALDEESSEEPKGRNGKSLMNSMARNGQLRPILLTYFETAIYTEKTFGTMTESRG